MNKEIDEAWLKKLLLNRMKIPVTWWVKVTSHSSEMYVILQLIFKSLILHRSYMSLWGTLQDACAWIWSRPICWYQTSQQQQDNRLEEPCPADHFQRHTSPFFSGITTVWNLKQHKGGEVRGLTCPQGKQTAIVWGAAHLSLPEHNS